MGIKTLFIKNKELSNYGKEMGVNDSRPIREDFNKMNIKKQLNSSHGVSNIVELNQSAKCILCPFNTFPELKFMGCGNNICIVDNDYKLKI